ncbi:acyl-CoA dehydrogenase family protein [Rhizobium puerariae]|uniref:Acyl-CoA dehydrogenase family protein n=1 Tax=Rhizobium puerariae TaxID=1585791 RepID=A0ABV6AF17_9HYPH
MASMDADTAALLREAVGKHAERTADGRAVRARRNDLPGHAPETLAVMAEQGWLALALPEDSGGLGLGVSAAGIVAEGLAGCFTADPFHSLFLAGRVLVHAGAGAELLAGLATAEALPALAWQENPQGFRLAPPATTFAAGRVSGQKAWVAGAAGASHYIVSASGPDGLALVLVEAGISGSQLSHDFRADGSPTGRLALDAAPGTVLATGKVAERALRAALDETSVLVAAELMGHVDRMMALVIEHLKTRRQFGKLIGAFQALQHRAADMFVHQRLARAVLDAGLARFDELRDPVARGMQAARLRARLNDTAQLVIRESIQLFGAMGITDENDLSLHVKRCLSLICWLGSSVEQRGYYMDLAEPQGQAAEGRI